MEVGVLSCSVALCFKSILDLRVFMNASLEKTIPLVDSAYYAAVTAAIRKGAGVDLIKNSGLPPF